MLEVYTTSLGLKEKLIFLYDMSMSMTINSKK